MPDLVIGLHTIGQTPREDLVAPMRRCIPEAKWVERGALDDQASSGLPTSATGGYPLETRLLDGTRVVIDAEVVEPMLQVGIEAIDEEVDAHFVLCAGPFGGLSASRPLVVPHSEAVTKLRGFGYGSLEVVVPFEAQAGPARAKWEADGFRCTTHVLERHDGEGWHIGALERQLQEASGEAIVFDYVGFPTLFLDRVAASTSLPVFDVGHLAMRHLRTVLGLPPESDS